MPTHTDICDTPTYRGASGSAGRALTPDLAAPALAPLGAPPGAGARSEATYDKTSDKNTDKGLHLQAPQDENNPAYSNETVSHDTTTAGGMSAVYYA